QSQVVDAGGTLTFTTAVDDAGLGAILQWQRDGVDLVDGGDVSGATTDTLTITNASAEDVGVYNCVASAAGTTATSEGAIGAVRQSPSVFDVNGDGSVDFFDVAALLDAL
ncbi:MAG: immunoglobulin domain-containing protein, partial [Planctomycetota bacterium]